MPNILDEIVENTRRELEVQKNQVELNTLIEKASELPPPPDFLAAIQRTDEVALIAEVKRASPSKGLIREDFDPLKIAKTYAANGASCVSVLTDQKFFQGHLDYLSQIHQAVDLPLLRKDFIVDPFQVYQARVAGASAVLLIAECLQPTELLDLHDLIISLKMTPLVEFHEVQHLQDCLDIGAKLIGVNNRNLNTFETNIEHVVRMRQYIPGDRCVVAESGIESQTDVQFLTLAGVDAMLVGESLMRKPDIGLAVRTLLGK